MANVVVESATPEQWALSVPADHNRVPFQAAGEIAAGELAAWSVLKISGRP
jgi:hypothetical protein